MAIAEVTTQRAVATGSSATASATYAATPTQNDLLIAVVRAQFQGGVTPTTPSGWTLGKVVSGGPICALFYKVAGASEPTTLSIALTISGAWVIELTEFSGCATTSPLDVTSSATTNSTSVNCGALGTLANATELVVTAYSNSVNYTFSAYNNTQTQSQQQANGTSCSLATAYAITSSTASVTYGATQSASASALCLACAFKPFVAASTDSFSLASTLGAATLAGTWTDTHTDAFSLSSTLGAATVAGTWTDTPSDLFSLASTLGAATVAGTFADTAPDKLTNVVQHLEPGAQIILCEIDCTTIGDTIHRFHGYEESGNIVWQGNTYSPWPIQLAGFARTSDQQPVPTIAVGNVDGSISALCITFADLVGSTLRIHKTVAKFLDAINFSGGNPTADPTQEAPVESWFIERKAHEDSKIVQFELASPLDLDGMQLPRRQIIANVCSWLAIGGYRGPYCGYTGGPVAKADDTATSDPTLDVCGGRVSSCKLRFGAANQLPFGGFPAARLIN